MNALTLQEDERSKEKHRAGGKGEQEQQPEHALAGLKTCFIGRRAEICSHQENNDCRDDPGSYQAGFDLLPHSGIHAMRVIG